MQCIKLQCPSPSHSSKLNCRDHMLRSSQTLTHVNLHYSPACSQQASWHSTFAHTFFYTNVPRHFDTTPWWQTLPGVTVVPRKSSYIGLTLSDHPSCAFQCKERGSNNSAGESNNVSTVVGIYIYIYIVIVCLWFDSRFSEVDKPLAAKLQAMCKQGSILSKPLKLAWRRM